MGDLMTGADVARMLGYTRQNIVHLERSGHLRGFRSGWHVYYRKEDVERLIVAKAKLDAARAEFKQTVAVGK